jgi:hypothetical protein
MADAIDSLWLDVFRLCEQYVSDKAQMMELVRTNAQLVTIYYRIALARPEMHPDLQQKAIDAVASLAATIIQIAPAAARDELIDEFTRLNTRLHEEYHRVAPGEKIH